MVSSFMSRVGKISVNVTQKSESIRRRYITLREGEQEKERASAIGKTYTLRKEEKQITTRGKIAPTHFTE